MITEEILSWVTTLPKWEQKLAYHIIEKRHITDAFLDEVYSIFKIEKKLEKGIISEEEIVPCSMEVLNNPTVLWEGVGNLHGVNRLKSNSSLRVSKGLTIVYGENGSGKSGYTRLLNNAFISRGDQEILPNIYEDNHESISADFSFLIDGNHVNYKYPDSKGEYAFKTIRNYDSKSASDDMNRESTIDFAPSELEFFDILLSACLEIQKKLDKERSEKIVDNPIIKYFPNEGKALKQMANLSSNTNIDVLKNTFTITDEEKRNYEKIKIEKANLVALDINHQISLINQVIDLLKKAENKYELFENAVSKENIDIYNQQIMLLRKSKMVHDTDGLALFSNDNIEKIGTDDWKDFIQAAKKYFDEINNHYKCPLCGNNIDKDDLIYRYWKYLDSDAENNLKVAKEALRYTKQGLSDLDLSFLVESSVQEQWLVQNFKKESDDISASFKYAEHIKIQILEDLENEKEININNIAKKPDIQGLIDKIDIKKNGLNQESINNRIMECSIIENEFVDKTKVIELFPIIINYVDVLKWDAKVEKSKIKTRAITNKQKELFEKYVTDDYLKLFKEECNKLKAPFDVEIVSRGSGGHTLKKLQIRGTAPGKVLSEGEQKAISIANFLTEVQMDSRNIGIVLDDPVCSLDHKRRTYIVDRLLEEVKKRQVVIFTHEITFFLELKTKAQRNGVVFEQETIRNICGEPGDISQVIPWQGMNVKDRIGKLKNDRHDMVKIFKSGDIDTYYYRAKEWCELLRESWERAVEEILFNDAIQRYNPCVQTQRLRKAPFTQELYSELEQGMTDCSAWCHDQARAINGTIPTPDDLKKYIDDFERYYKQHKP